MIVLNDWTLPHLNFEPYYDKPPMLYWLCSLSYLLFGISETAARLVPATAAWLTLAATIWFGNRWFNPKVGLFSGGVLVLSAGFAFCSRYLLIDGLLTLLTTLSPCTAYESMRGEQRRVAWWCASAICSGLGLITGNGSPLLDVPAVQQFRLATVGHEFAEVPYYLGRSDVPHFRDIRDESLTQYVSGTRPTILFVRKEMTNERLRAGLPSDASVEVIAQRGPAMVLCVTCPNQVAKQRIDKGSSLNR